MKLVRYGAPGREKPGIVDGEGRIHDLSGQVPDIAGEALSPKSLAKLAKVKISALPLVRGNPRIGPCVGRVGNFIAIGLNYADHAAESNMAIPSEPIIFTKAISCLNGPNDDVMLPVDSIKSDWEVELGVILGQTARSVSDAHALECVAGYVLANDVSERGWQFEHGGTWDKGKGFDTFGPVGPWLVTPDEVGDPQSLGLFLDVNGKRMQTGNTRTMIFTVAQLIAYVSRCITLHPGDLLITGTPPGVGMGMKPPVYLKPGDTMHLGIERLGEQRQRVVSWRRLDEPGHE